MRADDIIHFWFEQTPAEKWWQHDAAFDALIRQRFGELHVAAARGELQSWRQTPKGRLAEVMVLDQFSRNLHRDSAAAFACDGMALVLAQEALALSAMEQLSSIEAVFLCLPFMHSESRLIQQQSIQWYQRIGIKANLDFAERHKAIIDRFGRYPHRNAVLGRVSTSEETEFLTHPGSSF